MVGVEGGAMCAGLGDGGGGEGRRQGGEVEVEYPGGLAHAYR